MMNEEALQEQASYYVTRLHSGEMSGQEEYELERWRQQSDAHEAAFCSMLALWDLSNNLYQPAQQTRRSSVGRVWGLTAAAAVLVSVLAMAWMQPSVQTSSEPAVLADADTQITVQPEAAASHTAQRIAAQSAREHRYLQTGLGEVDTVALSDGSVLTLNTETRIQIAFNQHERHVVLVAGEAFFDVAPDA